MAAKLYSFFIPKRALILICLKYQVVARYLMLDAGTGCGMVSLDPAFHGWWIRLLARYFPISSNSMSCCGSGCLYSTSPFVEMT